MLCSEKNNWRQMWMLLWWVTILVATPVVFADSDSVNTADSADNVDSEGDGATSAALKAEIPKDELPKLEITLSPKKVAVGQVARWQVSGLRKGAERVLLPEKLSFNGLEIIGRHGDDDKKDHIGVWIDLVSFKAGDYAIAPQRISIVDQKGRLSEVMTPAFTLTVKSLLANAPNPTLKLDKGKGEQVMVEDYTLAWVGVGLVAILLVVLLTLLGRKLWLRRKPKPGPPPPPPRPAHEVALEGLDALAAAGYLDEGLFKVFYLKLSEIFRAYLGGRYGFDSLERSTAELVAILRQQDVRVDMIRRMQTFLEDTDLVKFAKLVPDKFDSERLLGEARSIVEETMVGAAPSSSSVGADRQGGSDGP